MHLALLLLAACPSPADDPFVFDARSAEHLLSRAGFGATSERVAQAVDAGLEATIERLLAGSAIAADPFRAERLSPYNQRTRDRMAAVERELGRPIESVSAEDRQEVAREVVLAMRRDDRRQLDDYTEWWVERMLEDSHPLRERMALFWHGYFTSSRQDVRDSYELIAQHELIREHALGSFADLLHGISRSPAMLEYLDNDVNRKGEPNENFARELLELFTLGEGHYTEQDVIEVARAFTGWTDRRGEFVFRRSQHDSGQKTIFGVTDEFDGDDVLDLLLARDRTADYVAGRIVSHFEGREVSTERASHYGAILRQNGLELEPMLSALFRDPDFYREEIVGDRIASPVDLAVGLALRTRIPVPPLFVVRGAQLLGQELFNPPNVKGWDGGETWITTATFMRRGNLAGVLLGEVSIDDLLDDDESEMGDAMEMDEGAGGGVANRPLRRLRAVERRGWTPKVNLAWRLEQAGAATDVEIVDRLLESLLAVEPGPGTREELARQLTDERVGLDIREGSWVDAGSDGERCLRRLAHKICSLPEAQLH